MRRRPWALVALCVTAAVAGCGGNDDESGGASAGDLKKRLPGESLLPAYKVERTFEWDNAVDATVQGLPLPESTVPSRGVDVFEDAGFEAGAGQQLIKGRPFEGTHANVAVFEFGSEEDADDAGDFVHELDLKQPCFAVCSVEGREMAVDGVPNAKGAHLRPLRNPPQNAPPPFEVYAVQFVIGSRLFRVASDGAPKQVDKELVLGAARRLLAANKGD